MRRRSEFAIGAGAAQQPVEQPALALEPPAASAQPVEQPKPAAAPQPVAERPAEKPVEQPPAVQPTRGYTGTTCPECRLAQWYMLDGVTCPNGHSYFSLAECSAGAPAMSAAAFAEQVQRRQKPAAAAPEPEPPPAAVAAVQRADESPAASLPQPEPEASPAAAQPPPARRSRSRSASRKGSNGKDGPVEIAPEAMRPTAGTEDRSSVGPTAEQLAAVGCVPIEPLGEQPTAKTMQQQRREKVAAQIDAFVLDPGYERIVEHVFAIDPWGSYEPLELGLKLPGPAHAANHAMLVDALDQCEDNAREAHRLFVSAKTVVDRFEFDSKVLSVDMRDQAVATLQAEKEGGQRSKQITDADVEFRIAALFPDEWRRLEERRAKARRMVAHMERLAELWRERSRDLRSQLDNLR